MNKSDASVWCIKGKDYLIDKPWVMGILNVTPDSFSDGGRYYHKDDAVAYALNMVEHGARIIDIGGESSRPGSGRVDLDTELTRVIPVVEALSENSDVLISVDTYKYEVARQALSSGASIINDISAGSFDAAMFDLIAESKAGYIMMHMKGSPEDMQNDPYYHDVVEEEIQFFNKLFALSNTHGIKPEQLVIDPGIGFGKRTVDNLKIINNLFEIISLKRPVLIGASRKSFIGAIDGSEVDDRLGGSLATAVISIVSGAKIIRAHDIFETRQAIDIVDAILNS